MFYIQKKQGILDISDIVILPYFDTQSMTTRIPKNKKRNRMMLTLGFSLFRQRLIQLIEVCNSLL